VAAERAGPRRGRRKAHAPAPRRVPARARARSAPQRPCRGPARRAHGCRRRSARCPCRPRARRGARRWRGRRGGSCARGRGGGKSAGAAARAAGEGEGRGDARGNGDGGVKERAVPNRDGEEVDLAQDVDAVREDALRASERGGVVRQRVVSSGCRARGEREGGKSDAPTARPPPATPRSPPCARSPPCPSTPCTRGTLRGAAPGPARAPRRAGCARGTTGRTTPSRAPTSRSGGAPSGGRTRGPARARCRGQSVPGTSRRQGRQDEARERARTCMVHSTTRLTTSSWPSTLPSTPLRAISPTARHAPCALPSPSPASRASGDSASANAPRTASTTWAAKGAGRTSDRRARYLADE